MSNPYFVPSGSVGPDGSAQGQTFMIICPVCGDRNLTTGSPSDDGATYAMPLEGDCGHRWNLILKTEKGQTFLQADVPV